MLNPEKRVMVMTTTLKTTAITPMMDILCKIAISFLRMKKRLTKIAPTDIIILTIYPEL